MQQEIKDILGKGLSQGFMGNTHRGTADRAGFTVDTSDYSGPEGRYHDEWAAHQSGGGQELVETPNGKKATRVYAGGNIPQEELDKLGITEKEVIQKLIYFVGEAGSGTRQDTEIELKTDDWRYVYKILKTIPAISLNVGEEDIFYKEVMVFAHFHVNAPVK